MYMKGGFSFATLTTLDANSMCESSGPIAVVDCSVRVRPEHRVLCEARSGIEIPLPAILICVSTCSWLAASSRNGDQGGMPMDTPTLTRSQLHPTTTVGAVRARCWAPLLQSDPNVSQNRSAQCSRTPVAPVL